MNNKQPAKWVRVGERGEKRGRETIRMTDKDKGKGRNTVDWGKREQKEKRKVGRKENASLIRAGERGDGES